jgi:glycosyltransferase
MKQPLLSVVTVCFNSTATIGDTLSSLACLANYADRVEYLVMDGGSRDGTQALVQERAAALKLPLVLHSERDRGLYDAMNKGLGAARGEYVWFLNSDDLLASAEAFAALIALLERKPQIVVADIAMVDAEDTARILRPWPVFGVLNQLWLGWHPPHPGFVARAEFLREVGGFDLQYRIAADFDLMTRSWRKLRTGSDALHLPQVLTRMRAGGASNNGLRAIVRGNREVLKSLWQQGVWAAPLAVAFKLARKLLQVLTGKLRALTA